MRRGIVLLCFGWGVLWMLFLNQFMLERKFDDSFLEQPAVSNDTGIVSFPYEPAGTKLLIKGIGIYEGPYLEDGSNSPVTNIAALLVENRSEYPIKCGTIVLEIAKEQYVFKIYAVPPAECVFVCESDRKQFTNKAVTACKGWVVEDVWYNSKDAISVTEISMDTLEITNITDQVLPQIQLLYKSYDEESKVYIGGICHSLDILSLNPGETRSLSPRYYVRGYSRLVAVKILK